MSTKAFINFVELPTKIASLVPFLVGSVYSLYRYGEIKLVNLIIMFVSMITFDMATTAINNYCDYKNELKHLKDEYNGRNPMFIHGISQKTGLITIGTLLSIATLFGIILTIRTNPLVLLMGIICFIIGIFYTFGPIPISRMPLGEIFSGVFMGLFITFITIYVNIYDKDYFGIYLYGDTIVAKFNIVEALVIFLISIPLITGIANIMLSNNICDLEDDIKVNRFTLPYYLGKDIGIIIYEILYYIGYTAIVIGVLTRILPITSALCILTLIPVIKNINSFKENQIKSKTFILSIKNFIILSVVYILSIACAII